MVPRAPTHATSPSTHWADSRIFMLLAERADTEIMHSGGRVSFLSVPYRCGAYINGGRRFAIDCTYLSIILIDLCLQVILEQILSP